MALPSHHSFHRIWELAMAQCELFLGHDYQQVNTFKDSGDLLFALQQTGLYSGQMTPILTIRLEQCLGRLQRFMSVMNTVMHQDPFPTHIVWNILNLLIESLDRCQLSNFVGLLEQMVFHLSIFQEYAWIFKENSDLDETIILAFVSTIVFLSEATDSLKQHTANDPVKQDTLDESWEQGRQDELEQGKQAAWEAIQKQFGEMIKQVGWETARIKQRAQALKSQSRQPNLQVIIVAPSQT